MLLILLIESASHPLQQFIHVSMENLVNCQLQDAYNGTKKHMANISMNDHFNEMAKKKKKQKRANHKCKTNTSTNKKKQKSIEIWNNVSNDRTYPTFGLLTYIHNAKILNNILRCTRTHTPINQTIKQSGILAIKLFMHENNTWGITNSNGLYVYRNA